MVMFLVFQYSEVGTGAHHHFPVIIRFVLLFDSSIRGSGPRANELSTTGKDPIERTARENSCGVLIGGAISHLHPEGQKVSGLEQDVARSAARRPVPPPTAPPPW
jgi:hypothetical protein